jgi:NhaP-type Na+/H+ or K+/H+ antiporter
MITFRRAGLICIAVAVLASSASGADAEADRDFPARSLADSSGSASSAGSEGSAGSAGSEGSSGSHASVDTHGSGGSGGSGGSHGDGGHHVSLVAVPVIFGIMLCVASVASTQFCKNLPAVFQLPHTVVMFLLGATVSALAEFYPGEEGSLQWVITYIQVLDAHIIFWVLLPVLLFEDAFDVTWKVMERCIKSSLLLALPGVALNAVLTGALIKATFWTTDAFSDWPTAIMTGSILAATDPVAVIGALKALKAPEKLSNLIKGESLCNDGSSFVMFVVFRGLAEGGEFNLGAVVGLGLQMVLLAPVFSIVVCTFTLTWVAWTDDLISEMMLLLMTVYGIFYVAELPSVSVSAVLAVVVVGFIMAESGKYALNPKNMHGMHEILHFCSHIANEAIFFCAGIIGGYSIVSSEFEVGPQQFAETFILYIFIHITRFTVLALCFPLLKNMGYGLTWKEAAICLYGGLRGAVGLAMAMLLSHSTLSKEVQFYIMFHASMITLLTLIINGTTIGALYKKLEVYTIRKKDENILKGNLGHIEHHGGDMFDTLKEHWLFSDLDKDLMNEILPPLSKFEPMLQNKDTAGACKAAAAQQAAITSALKNRVYEDTDPAEKKKVSIFGFQRTLTRIHKKLALKIEDKIALEMWKVAQGRDMKYNPMLPNAPSPARLEKQIRETVNHKLNTGHLKYAYAGQVGGATNSAKFGVAGKVVLAEITETKTMLLKFAKDAAHHEHHDDHGHGHDDHGHGHSEEMPLVKSVGSDALAEIHELILHSVKGQLLYLYESATVGYTTNYMFENGFADALAAATGELKQRAYLKTSGDPVLQNLASETGRQTDMSIVVLWEAIASQLGEVPDERSFMQCLGTSWGLWYEWTALRCDAEIVCNLIIVFDHVLDSYSDLLKKFPSVLRGLCAMQAQAKRRLLAPLYYRSPKLFNLWQHLFAARRILNEKQHAVHHLLHEGTMMKADAELVEPVLETFAGYMQEPYNMYTPRAEAMLGADGKKPIGEIVKEMKAMRMAEREARKEPRKSLYYVMHPENAGVVPVKGAKAYSELAAADNFVPPARSP